ncbi:hypothetical protein V8F06_010551 [Rhypophila decipiens]
MSMDHLKETGRQFRLAVDLPIPPRAREPHRHTSQIFIFAKSALSQIFALCIIFNFNIDSTSLHSIRCKLTNQLSAYLNTELNTQLNTQLDTNLNKLGEQLGTQLGTHHGHTSCKPRRGAPTAPYAHYSITSSDFWAWQSSRYCFRRAQQTGF